MPRPWPRHKPNRQRPKANGHKLEAMAQDIRYPWVRVGEACGPGHCLGLARRRPRHKPNRKRLMAISLEPRPKILDIRGCAWGKPVGSRRPGNPRLINANSFYSHKNRPVTKLSSKCLPFCGKASGLDSGLLRRLCITLFFA